MNSSTISRFVSSAIAILLCSPVLLSPRVFSQESKAALQPDSIISLAHQERPEAEALRAPREGGEHSFANAPANFHAFAPARAGEDAGVEALTLNFSASTTLTKIASTSKEFVVESGGTCAEGKSFSAGQSCTVLVRFKPQGAGNRTGKLSIGHSASPMYMNIGLGGNGYAPVISFTPAMITTVPGTYPSNVGLLSGASGLSIDGNDTLYVADTGNNLVRYFDSSNTWRTLASGYTAPFGITTDTFGEVYFDLSGSNHMYEVYGYGPVVQIDGTGTASCPASTPCTLSSEALATPGLLTNDPYNRLFFPENHSGVAMVTAQPVSAKLAFLYDPFPFQESPVAPVAVDTSDNLYSPWQNGGTCSIIRQTLSDAENSNVNFTKVVGGHACGFSGDGGQAGNAEIGNRTGGIVFDLAGNLYFSDTANQRVRRVDRATGQISTIAGNGTAGYHLDNSPATSANISYPTGVAVDSQGQVYIISGTGTTSGGAQVIRKLGPSGMTSFGSFVKGNSSPAQTVTVSNVGNNDLVLSNSLLTGTNAGDFSIDPATTTCLLTSGSELYEGQSCKIGFIFKPTGSGTRTANFVLLSNTVTGSSTIHLLGTGTLPVAPTVKMTSPASGASITVGTPITIRVTVTSTSSPAPTGTVTFSANGNQIGSPVTLSGGAAQVSTTPGTTGSKTLTAVYSGDANYSTATVSETITVIAAASTPTRIISAPVKKHLKIASQNDSQN